MELWGTDRNNIWPSLPYVYGFAHYDGNRLSHVQSGVSVDIEDVCDISGTVFLAVF